MAVMLRLMDDIRQLVREVQRGRTGVSGESVRGEVPEREPGELRVMTFNVRGALHPDGLNAWRRRAALSVEVIRRWKPDLIGFQEFQRGNERTYARELPGYGMELGPKYQNRMPYAYNAVLWDPEKVELVERGGFWISETPERFSGSWGTRQVRSANLLRLRLAGTDREFLHLNTHLDHRSVPARQNGARLIVDRLEKLRDMPAVVTGDFNAEPGRLVYRTFEEAGFADTHVLCGVGRQKTFHRFEGERFARGSGREFRMDWVLVRGGSGGSWKALGAEVVPDCDPPVFPSDHYPVVARLRLVGSGE